MYNRLVNRDIICPARTRCYVPTAVVAQLIALFASVSRLDIAENSVWEKRHRRPELSSCGRGGAMCIYVYVCVSTGRFIAFDHANKLFSTNSNLWMVNGQNMICSLRLKKKIIVFQYQLVSILNLNMWKLKKPLHKCINGKLIDSICVDELETFDGISILYCIFT